MSVQYHMCPVPAGNVPSDTCADCGVPHMLRCLHEQIRREVERDNQLESEVQRP